MIVKNFNFINLENVTLNLYGLIDELLFDNGNFKNIFIKSWAFFNILF